MLNASPLDNIFFSQNYFDNLHSIDQGFSDELLSHKRQNTCFFRNQSSYFLKLALSPKFLQVNQIRLLNLAFSQ